MEGIQLRNSSRETFEGSLSDPIDNYCYIAHDCPLCGKKGSYHRALAWIVYNCIESEGTGFPCDSCGEYLKFPSSLFVDGFLESVTEKRPDGSPSFDDWAMKEKSPQEIFIPNWQELFFEVNKAEAGKSDVPSWDGKGACPGCGQASAQRVSQSLSCVYCREVFTVNQHDIDRNAETTVLCPNCRRAMIIPPTVWCLTCGLNLLPGNVFDKLFRKANEITEPVSDDKQEHEKRWWQFWK